MSLDRRIYISAQDILRHVHRVQNEALLWYKSRAEILARLLSAAVSGLMAGYIAIGIAHRKE